MCGRATLSRSDVRVCSFAAQKPNSGLGRLVVEVSGSQKLETSHSVGLPRTSDHSIAKAATYKTHNKHKRLKAVLSTGIEAATLAIKRL
jgi:hypothetical protein